MADDLRRRIIQAMADANTGEAWEQSPPDHAPLAAYADAVLTTLVDAGLLLPVGGETREEWGRPEFFHVEPCDVEPCNPSEAARCANQPDEHRRRTVTTWPDGSFYFGPWPACGPKRNSHMVSLGADVCLALRPARLARHVGLRQEGSGRRHRNDAADIEGA